MDNQAPHHSEPSRPGYERTDVRLRPIAVLTLILVVASIVSFVAAVVMFDALESREAAADKPVSPLAEPNPLPPDPRLQQVPQLDLNAYERRNRERLESYQWIDRDGGVVRIPVERAMELLIERGITPVEPGSQEAQAGTGTQ